MSRDSGPNVFQRGVMALILLSLLRREDMYGYQLVQETERRSGGRLKTQDGSLYPVLYRLQEQGLISDRRVLVGKRMTRVYYHLEPAGEARLEEMIREYESICYNPACSYPVDLQQKPPAYRIYSVIGGRIS